MAFYRGEEGSVSFKNSSGVVATVASTRNWSLTINKDTLDTTSHGLTSRTFVGGLLSGSGSIELMYTQPASGAAFELTQDVLTTEDPADAQFELYLDTGKKITFNGIITSTDYTANVGDLEVITCNFITSGAITASI